jgi:hypothetical protein
MTAPLMSETATSRLLPLIGDCTSDSLIFLLSSLQAKKQNLYQMKKLRIAFSISKSEDAWKLLRAHYMAFILYFHNELRLSPLVTGSGIRAANQAQMGG